MKIGKIKNKDLTLLCTQFSTLLLSGSKLNDCIKIIAKQTNDEKLKKILLSSCKDVESGKMLSTSLSLRGKNYIPSTFIETVKAGEKTGNLHKTFDGLKDYYKRRESVSKQIKNALIYPAFVLSVAIVVLIVIMTVVMPKLLSIFDGMNGEIPLITKALIGISDFFRNNIFWIIALVIIIVIIFAFLRKNDNWKLKFDKFKCRLPIFGKIIIYNNSALFSESLLMLLTSGLELSNAVKILSNIFENFLFKFATCQMSEGIVSGKTMAYCMKKTECFPDALTDMVSIGEKSGELEKILDVSAEYFREETNNLIKKLLSMLEPAMLVLITAFAGFIVFAIYIPLFQMYDLF